MYQCRNGAILSRKCSIKAPAKWRNSVYVLTEMWNLTTFFQISEGPCWMRLIYNVFELIRLPVNNLKMFNFNDFFSSIWRIKKSFFCLFQLVWFLPINSAIIRIRKTPQILWELSVWKISVKKQEWLFNWCNIITNLCYLIFQVSVQYFILWNALYFPCYKGSVSWKWAWRTRIQHSSEIRVFSIIFFLVVYFL